MIFPRNPQYYDGLRKEQFEEAAQSRMLHQAGVDTRGWTAVQMCRAICGIGRLLISLGRRLEHFGEPVAVHSDKIAGLTN